MADNTLSKDFTYEYDPVKQVKDGDQAVIWTTKALNTAVDAINKGLPLKSNPFIGKNSKLLKPDLVYKRTKEEIDDYIHCMQDPVYFASKCFLMTPEGLQPVELRDYQIDYIKHLQNHRFSILKSCRQAGKSTSTAIYCLWKIIFSTDKSGLILSKSGPAGIDLLNKIKDMFLYLPYYLKPGIMKWNQHEISFDNNSSISTEAFSPTAGLGKTINFLILDEFAWCNPNEVELFYNNIIPTITTITDSNVCIMSTQNGFNLFYKLWDAAIRGKNIYAPFNVDWWQVPQWNPKTKSWEKRTEAWKQEMIGVLGSEEAFLYQYGTAFAVSDYCILTRQRLTDIHSQECRFINRTEELMYASVHPECLFVKPDYDVSKFKTTSYIILIDLAEGGGADYTVFNIFELSDKDHFDQVAFWRSNTVELESAALEFWLLYQQLFTPELALISIEWNTYGALFYNYLLNYNNDSYGEDSLWRFNYGTELDLYNVVQYKKGDNTEDIAGISGRFRNSKYIPGIRFTASNKITACTLLKMLLNNGNINIYDINQISECENFEDKNGTGSYKASYGHDDMMMTLCQIPMAQQSTKFKEFIETLSEYNVSNKLVYDDGDIYSMRY